MTLKEYILECNNEAYYHPQMKRFKSKIGSSHNKIVKMRKDGDVFLYLKRFSIEDNQEEELIEALRENGLKSFESIYQEVLNSKEYNLNDYSTVDDLIIGEEYDSYDICVHTDNYNLLKGMYSCKNKNGDPALVIKATISDNEDTKYKNEWLQNKDRLKYYMETTHGIYNKDKVLRFETNRLILFSFENHIDLPIYVFSRDSKNKKFQFEGIYNVVNIHDYQWLEMVKRDSLSKEDVSRQIDKIKLELSVIDEKYRETYAKARIGQGLFRELLLKNHNQKCNLCAVHDKKFLIASHIKPFSVCSNNEACDVDNGLILCPNHDKLFDRGFISFDNDGELLISSELNEEHRRSFGVDEKITIFLNENTKEYMDYHRKNQFLK